MYIYIAYSFFAFFLNGHEVNKKRQGRMCRFLSFSCLQTMEHNYGLNEWRNHWRDLVFWLLSAMSPDNFKNCVNFYRF